MAAWPAENSCTATTVSTQQALQSIPAQLQLLTTNPSILLNFC
jgi:hypothetical protein